MYSFGQCIYDIWMMIECVHLDRILVIYKSQLNAIIEMMRKSYIITVECIHSDGVEDIYEL